MLQVSCLFFVCGSHIIAIHDESTDNFELIHPFQTDKRLFLEGLFSAELMTQLHHSNAVRSPHLLIIENQHPWLKGLSSASLRPQSMKQLLLGDNLGLLFLEITDQCNERCIHCYASSSPECHDFLSLDEIKSVLSQARALGQAFVQFTGGDPLIHRDLVQAVAYARELDFQDIEIYTNGLLLNEALLEKLFPYLPTLAFSLYSADEITHDSITQVKGSWKRTVAAMHRSQDMAFKIRIGMAIMEQNAGHEQAMLDFVKNTFALDEKSVRFDPVHQTGRGKSLNTQHIVLKPSQNPHMPEVTAPKQYQVVQRDKVTSNIAETITGRRGKLAVCANGDVAPCIFNREHVLGNIRQASLLDMLGKGEVIGNENPSVARWNHCQSNLSCSDCQMVAYTLGESSASLR